jgi:hypothetical protein
MKASGICSGMKAKEGIISVEMTRSITGFTTSKERHMNAGQSGADGGAGLLSRSSSGLQPSQQDLSAFATDTAEKTVSRPVNIEVTASRTTMAMILNRVCIDNTIAIQPPLVKP